MDRDSFIARTEGDPGLMLEMIQLFQTDAPRLYADVLAAIQNNDCAALHVAAHALKGSISNFSADPASAAAAVLEESGKRGDMSNVPLACTTLIYEIDRLQLALGVFAKRVIQ